MVARRTYTFWVVLTLWVQLLTWPNYLCSSTTAIATNRNITSVPAVIAKETAISSTTAAAASLTNPSVTKLNNLITANWFSTPLKIKTTQLPLPPTPSPQEAIVGPLQQQPRAAVTSSSSSPVSSLKEIPTTTSKTTTTPRAAPIDVSNCLGQMECDALEELEPPPELMPFLPPPPPPASLFKSLALPFPGDQLDLDDTSAVSGVEEGGPSSAFLIAHRDVCNLCVWANRENDTETATIPALGITQETTWISILVLASLASAVVGAIFMIMFLKCRKFKILPMKDSCPILPDSYFGNKNNNNNHQSSNNSCVSSNENVGVDPSGGSLNSSPKTKSKSNSRLESGGGNTGGTTHSSSIWNFWRRTSSSTERPLRSPGSLCSEENSYSEEPYVVSEHSSALYAELNSVSQDGNGAYRTYSMNTYSEVCDPNINKKISAVLCSPGGPPCHHTHHHHHHHHHRHLVNDGTYENAAYVLSENTVECHHGCPVHSNPQQLMLQETDSLDTPSSSAYYSDSSNQNQANGRKRKKKQLRPMTTADDVIMNDEDIVITDTISANLPVANYYPPLGANFNTSIGGGQLQRYRHEPFNTNSLRVIVQQQPIRIHEGHGLVVVATGGGQSGKRPLPPAPPVPPPMPPQPPPIQTSTPIGTPINNAGQQSPTFLSSSNRSSIRPLPPVPSQYV